MTNTAPAAVPYPVCPTCNGRGTMTAADYHELMERPGQTRTHAPATSRRAGTTPRKGTQRALVLQTLAEWGHMTAYRCALFMNKSPNQIATRLGELHDDGFVTYLRDEAGVIVEAETTPGNTGMVHTCTPSGMHAHKRVLES
jgi:hypothetical protein